MIGNGVYKFYNALNLSKVVRGESIIGRYSRLCQTRPCTIPGFVCYVSDALEAPPAVMTHLCKERRINAVPIFRDGTLAEDVERRGVTKYFIGKNLHTVKNNSRVGMGMLVFVSILTAASRN